MARRKKRDENQLDLFSLLDETIADVSGETSTISKLVPSEGAVAQQPLIDTSADEAAREQSTPRPEVTTEPGVLEPVEVITDLKAATPDEYTGQPVTFTDDILPPRSAEARADANIAAIRTLHQLTTEKRWATPDEQHVLAQYSAWGACSKIFDRSNTAWADRRRELEQLVDESTFNALARTTLTAYYTPPEVVDAMWTGLREAGLTTGRVLEPGSGIGGFIRKANDTSQMVGVETDPIAAGIAQQLYPHADIHQMGFEKLNVPDNSFSAAIGNVPFGDIVLYDRHHNPDGLSIHNHFLTKSLDAVAPGGYVAMLTSSYTSDTATSEARAAMIARADLVSAMRLPSQTFRDVAGTDVTADLLVFRVREPDQEPNDMLSGSWLNTASYNQDIRVNSLFVDHTERILGTPQLSTGRFGRSVLTVTPEGDLRDQIVDLLREDLEEARAEGLEFTADQSAEAAAALEIMSMADAPIPGSVRYVEGDDGALRFEGYSPTEGWAEKKLPRGVKAEEWKALLDMRDTTVALRAVNAEGDTGSADELRARLNEQYDSYFEAYGAINRVQQKKPRTPSKSKQESEFRKLERAWRTDEQIPLSEPLPYEVEAEFREQVAQPTVGTLTEQRHLDRLRADPYIAQVEAIESYDPETGVASKNAIFTTNPASQAPSVEHTDDIHDAVAISLNKHGEIDPALVADLLGDERAEVENRLVDEKLAFRNPENPEAFIRANIYTSGYVKDKLLTARAAAGDDERFTANVQALREAIPKKIESDIHVTPGANWIPKEFYTQFAAEKFGIRESQIMVTHTGDNWYVEVDKHAWHWAGKADEDYGVICGNNTNHGNFNFQASDQRADVRNQGVATNRNDGVAVPAFEMYEHVLNLSSKALNHSTGYLTQHPNAPERHDQASEFAARKASQLRNAFSEWVMDDPDRRAQVIDRYNATFNSYVATEWDGTYREIPNLGSKFEPYDYQKNAVERMANQPSVLLNHVVGAGKTGTYFMGVAELKRLGKIQQPWIVVPNHLAEQITNEAIQWYPDAEVLSAAGVSDREGRRTFLAQTTAKDWDMVIVPQSVFERIPVSPATQAAYIEGELEACREEMAEMMKIDPESISVKEMERTIQRLETRMNKALDTARDGGLNFEDTPCDYLVIDEAHLYKNLQRISKVDDISHAGSNRASDLEMKLSYLRESLPERGKSKDSPVVTFATGTPVTNNLAEIWVMARYLRPDLLEQAGIDRVNAWAASFTESETQFEVNATGSGLKQVTRTSSYINAPQLATLCESFQDIVTRDDISAKLPEMVDVVVEFEVENEVKDFIADLGARAEMTWDGYNVSPAAIDNPVKQISDGRKASLHPKLANLNVDGPGARVSHVVDNVYQTWQEGAQTVYYDEQGEESARRGGFQIIFCDSGVPGGRGYNVYEEIRNELYRRGMPDGSVQFVHDWDKDRGGLYQRCRDGRVSVLIGSTQKLGTGANIQTRCQAVHHMDVPWNPADNEQRDGRAWRQGNQNQQVRRFRYIGLGTTDAPDWQRMYRKALFIEQLNTASHELKGKVDSEVSTQAQAAAQLKAIATGDPRYMRLEDMNRQISDLESQRNEWLAAENSAQTTRQFSERGIAREQEFIAAGEAVLDECQQWAESENRTWINSEGKTLTDRGEAAREFSRKMFEVFRSRSTEEQPIGTIGGLEFVGRYKATDSAAEIRPVNLPHSRSIKLDFNAFGAEFDATQRVGDKATSQQFGNLQRLENRVTRLGKELERSRGTVEEYQAEIDRIDNRKTGAFEAESELAELTAQRDDLQRELVDYENSPEFRRQERDRDERMEAHGRKPGWTLRLVPSPMYAEAVWHDSQPEVIYGAKVDDMDAQVDHGFLDRVDADFRLMQARDELGLPQLASPEGNQNEQQELASAAPTAESAFAFVEDQGLLSAGRPVTNGDEQTGQVIDHQDEFTDEKGLEDDL